MLGPKTGQLAVPGVSPRVNSTPANFAMPIMSKNLFQTETFTPSYPIAAVKRQLTICEFVHPIIVTHWVERGQRGGVLRLVQESERALGDPEQIEEL